MDARHHPTLARREAALLIRASWLTLAVVVPSGLLLLFGDFSARPLVSGGVTMGFGAIVAVVPWLARSRPIAALHVYLLASFAVAATGIALFGGIQGPNIVTLPLVVLFAGLVGGYRSALIYSVLSGAVIVLLLAAETAGVDGIPLYPVSTGGSALIAVVSTVLGVTFLWIALLQRKEAHHAADLASRAAQQNHERLEQLISESPDGLAWFDESGRLMEANPAFARICGAPQTRMIGSTVSQLGSFDQASRAEAIVAMERLAEGEGEQRFMLRAFDEPPFCAEVHAKNLVLPDGTKAFQWIARDVTEREEAMDARYRLEAELREARRLEDIGRLAGGIAHDFNNLLTAVNANAEILVRDESLAPKLRRQLGVIHQAGERAAALTRQLLAFARRQVLEMTPVRLEAVVESMVPLLEELLGDSVELAIHVHESIWVQADRSQLEQVVTNLVVNARDAMPRGGYLVISIGAALDHRHPTLGHGNYAVLQVTDSGTGMDEATQQRIFEPFFTTKQSAQGTGLGLAMVHGIIKQSGGHIAVNSTPGKGATFEVWLPAIEAPPSSIKVRRPREAPPIVGGTVLVVDDEPLVRQTVEGVLELSGFDVLSADGPEFVAEALRACTRLDLVITDVIMPGEMGPDLAVRLRERFPGLRVIFMSGYADHADIGRARDVPQSRYLQKPFSPRELREMVAEILAAPDEMVRDGSFQSDS